MKKIILLSIFFCVSCVSISLFAQQKDDKRKADFEEFKAKRVAFISEAMDLTQDQAKAFWPLCNELQEKKFELNKELRAAWREFSKAKKEGKTLTDEDYRKVIKLSADVKVKEAQLDREYLDKFEEVLPAEKVFLYQRAERQFARQMLDKDHKHRGGDSKRGK